MTSERSRCLGVMLMSAVLGLTGCTGAPKKDPNFAVSLPPASAHPEPQYNGAIYQSGYALAWFEDIRARRVGDVLFIRLAENTIATKEQSATLEKSTSSSLSEPTILGTQAQFNVPGVLPLVNTNDVSLESQLDSEHSFDGSSDASQRNSLTGDIAVTVAEVLPNGNLVVRGEKRLNLTEGNEYVKLSGIVRPTDIATDNTVLSTRLADATIVYSSDGQNAGATKLGWLARFFTSAVLPF